MRSSHCLEASSTSISPCKLAVYGADCDDFFYKYTNLLGTYKYCFTETGYQLKLHEVSMLCLNFCSAKTCVKQYFLLKSFIKISSAVWSAEHTHYSWTLGHAHFCSLDSLSTLVLVAKGGNRARRLPMKMPTPPPPHFQCHLTQNKSARYVLFDEKLKQLDFMLKRKLKGAMKKLTFSQHRL